MATDDQMIARFSIFLFFLFLTVTSFGQTVSRYAIAAAGNTFSASGITIESTVGQTPFLTLSAKDFYLTQGFQQPTKKDAQDNSPWNFIKLFPNPVTDYLTMIPWTTESKSFTIKIFSMTGSMLKNIIAPNLPPRTAYLIDFTDIPNGLYLLHIYETAADKKLFSVTKIVKIGKPIE